MIILKVRKFHWPTTSRFGTAKQKLIGEGAQWIVPPA